MYNKDMKKALPLDLDSMTTKELNAALDEAVAKSESGQTMTLEEIRRGIFAKAAHAKVPA